MVSCTFATYDNCFYRFSFHFIFPFSCTQCAINLFWYWRRRHLCPVLATLAKTTLCMTVVGKREHEPKREQAIRFVMQRSVSMSQSESRRFVASRSIIQRVNNTRTDATGHFPTLHPGKNDPLHDGCRQARA